MRVVIVHHHLNPGGVTRIIRSQIRALRALRRGTEIKILTGACPAYLRREFEAQKVTVTVKKVLNYSKPDLADSQKQFAVIKTILEKEIQPEDIFHVHNLNLGKNPLLTCAVYQLAENGVPVLNHCHDFAEDRPDNWKFLDRTIRGTLKAKTNEVLYPAFKNYKFAVLNSFDRKRLIGFGVRPGRITMLPNPVEMPEGLKGSGKAESRKKIRKALKLDPQKTIAVYPVRVIRRKNIGELILLSVLFSDSVSMLVTLAPKNPVEIKPYKKWKEFCRKNRLPVLFEAGDKAAFKDMMAGSDWCISTSLQEGFGMVFLEPWGYFTPVCGRDIPMVTGDFRKSGISFNGLYGCLSVPGPTGRSDFKDLSVREQQKMILHAQNDSGFARKILTTNRKLKTMWNSATKQQIRKNRNVLRKMYSIKQYGTRLSEIYSALSGSV